MKIVLVNPPKTDFDTSEIAPPLGLLRLAQSARAAGFGTSIVDLNLLYHIDRKLQDPLTFYESAVDQVLAECPDVVGLTSMCVDTHVAIHIARLLKEICPEIKIVVGGTHFSSIADRVFEEFPWIDFVVAGEGEGPIREIPQLLTIEKKGKVVRGTPYDDTNAIDLPFDLLDLEQYFSINPRRCLDFESGRGCRFKCAFCYSPAFYEEFRQFDIDGTIAGLERAAGLGFANVFFVEDNFLNDPVRAINFCREFTTARLNLKWQAYATFPQLTSAVISEMGIAGCTALFMGIDAVGKVSRRMHKKSFVRDLQVLRKRIQECVDNGLIPTCAFLLSPPSYPGGGDIDETLIFALAARNAGAQVRLNTLTLYNQTGTFKANASIPAYDEIKVRLMLDVPDVVEKNFYALENPQLFPFHSRYVEAGEWHNFLLIAHFLYTLMEVFPKTLEYLWENENISPLHVAKRMSDIMEPLLDIQKTARRDAEILAAIQVLEALAVGSYGVQALLESESDRFLAFII